MPNRFLIQSCIPCLVMWCLVIPVWGQPGTQTGDRPFMVMYARDINQKRLGDYLQRLSKRLSVAAKSAAQVKDAADDTMETAAPNSLNGVVFYLRKGVVPSIESVPFESVVDEAEAKKLLESRATRWGTQARLEADTNGMYRIVSEWSYENELAPNEKVDERTQEFPGYSSTTELIERDGKQYRKQSGRNMQQYRYQDRLLFSNQSAVFGGIVLPPSQEMIDSTQRNDDVGVLIYPDRVPVGLRNLGWGMLSAMLGTQLQQQDNESTERWQVRRAAGNWGLMLLKSFLFDVDAGEGTGTLASGNNPLRGEFQLSPRRNSGLVRQLDELGSGRSRFAALLRDEAAASVHFCVALPTEGKELLTATATWMQAETQPGRIGQAQSRSFGLLAGVLNDIADGGTLEVIVRLVHTSSSGSVLLTGIQLPEQPELLPQLEGAARELTANVSGGRVSNVQRHGRPLIRIELPEQPGQPIQLTNVWIAHRDGCLWLAAGGEQAHEMIRLAGQRCSSGGRAVRTRLITARLDVERWTSWPSKDPTGLARLPNWLDSAAAAQALTFMIPSLGRELGNPTPLLERVLASPGSKKAMLTLDADKSGLRLEAELGPPLADWFVARQLDAQEKYMETVIRRNEEAAKKAQEAAAATSQSGDESN